MLWAVDALSSVWVSVYTHPGGRGGVALMGGYVLDRAALTNEERRQLLAALQSLPGRKGAESWPSYPPCSAGSRRTGSR